MKDVWDTYKSRILVHGETKREAALIRESRMLRRKLPDSLSYHSVLIDGVSQDAAIINTDNLNEKYIYSLPGEDIKHGGLVEWMDNRWLVTERDANTTVYTKAKMLQCNHLLKWIDDTGAIKAQWSIVEDGTKYLTGEYEDRNYVTTRGDSRIAVTIARNADTIKLGRNQRFLIDDPESPHKLAYLLTKPLKLGGTFNNNGIFKFVLQEVTSTDDDSHVLGIADYYKHYPREPMDPDSSDEKDRWL